jgi:hypothetical protein
MNPTKYITKSERARFKYVVCFPSTRDMVQAFDTLKAARHFAENMTIEGFPWDFPARSPIPIIARESIEKYNLRKAAVAA